MGAQQLPQTTISLFQKHILRRTNPLTVKRLLVLPETAVRVTVILITFVFHSCLKCFIFPGADHATRYVLFIETDGQAFQPKVLLMVAGSTRHVRETKQSVPR